MCFKPQHEMSFAQSTEKSDNFPSYNSEKFSMPKKGSCHKRQKPQAPTPQAPIRNRQTRKVANAKVRTG